MSYNSFKDLETVVPYTWAVSYRPDCNIADLFYTVRGKHKDTPLILVNTVCSLVQQVKNYIDLKDGVSKFGGRGGDRVLDHIVKRAIRGL